MFNIFNRNKLRGVAAGSLVSIALAIMSTAALADIKTTVHLNFRGDAREALTFYQSVFGGDQMVITYKDAHADKNPAEAEQVIWGQVAAKNGFHVMAFDVPSTVSWEPGVIPVFVSVRGSDAGEITGYWKKLSEVSTIVKPLGPSGFSPLYGMVKDRFGVTWVLDVQTGP
jgi:PhnB protein